MSAIVHAFVGRDDDDRPAHHHAVAIALATGAPLESVHAPQGRDVPAPERASAVLSRWGVDPRAVEHSVREHTHCDDTVETLLHAIREAAPRLVVFGCRQRRGLRRAFVESHAEAIAGHLDVPALFVPRAARGFVGADGAPCIRRVLIAAEDPEALEAASEGSAQLLDALGLDAVETVRVCPPSAAAAHAVDLVVVACGGHGRWWSPLRTTLSARLLRRVGVPLLRVPFRTRPAAAIAPARRLALRASAPPEPS